MRGWVPLELMRKLRIFLLNQIVHRSDWYGNKVSEELRNVDSYTVHGGSVL